jgi:Rrf2 family protein
MGRGKVSDVRVTEQTRYALMVMVVCADAWPRHLPTRELALRTGLSEFTIFKLLKLATRAELLQSVRGRNGGVRLGTAPEAISVGRVMRAFEPRLGDCAGPEKELCAERPVTIEERLDQAIGSGFGAFLSRLDRITISDLARRGDGTESRLEPMAESHSRTNGEPAVTRA